ncbi:hypothetical protein EZS27_027053 [termite gut metagenome]|uniref:Antitoxin SocA-like Panacea domain-containing protein n=1 Tax=termite gut metagenome TaxID=433724 RepID=A0A5J4QPT6_9ZZZZ
MTFKFKNMGKSKVNQISDWILGKFNSDAGDTISPLKLQKLLYYCQAWHYTIFDKPIFDERIEAWAHGPVVPSQFKRFQYLGKNDSIFSNRIVDTEKVIFEKETEELLNEVIDIYGQHTAYYLEQLTHKERPWKETRGNLEPYERSDKEIPLKLMKEYYSSINK